MFGSPVSASPTAAIEALHIYIYIYINTYICIYIYIYIFFFFFFWGGGLLSSNPLGQVVAHQDVILQVFFKIYAACDRLIRAVENNVCGQNRNCT